MAIAQQISIQPDILENIPVLSVTPTAVNIIRTLLEQRQIPNHALRVFVSGGGCSGMQYGMAFEEKAQNFDEVVEMDGVRLLVDPTSMMYLRGATIDYVDSLMGGGFRIENPNAVSSCGCGHSFKAGDSGEESASGGGCGSGSCSH
ncbi:MAG: iron-sulfur cluster insertion protein ErpA [Burkholderiales bacterium]|nr:iron-sulfur cluster insertion protein ErpA [Anaerolineae bacterium]